MLAPATQQYNLTGKSSIWINSRILAPNAPATKYTGLTIQSGTISLSEMPVISGDKTTLSATNKITVKLKLRQQTVIDANDKSPYGADARAATFVLPDTLEFEFNSTSSKITDAAGAAGDYFGYSVSISGNYAIMGANGDDIGANANQGSASIYLFNGSLWVLMQKLNGVFGSAQDAFGNSVSISGNYAIVAAYADDVVSNVNQGSANIYQQSGGSWTLMQTLTPVAGMPSDFFGYSVSISGDYAIVGAAETERIPNPGSATIYQRVGPGWKRVQAIKDPGGNSFQAFGETVSIDAVNKRFLIGARSYANQNGNAIFGKVN